MKKMVDVPKEEVGDTVQDFIDNDVKRLEVFEQPDGKFTIAPKD